MLDDQRLTDATNALRDTLQDTESKMKVVMSHAGGIAAIHPDSLIELVGGLKAELLSMKCDVILLRAIIFAHDETNKLDDEQTDNFIASACAYLEKTEDTLNQIAEARKAAEANKPKIITGQGNPLFGN